MKLSPIQKQHVEEAAEAISHHAVPKNQLSNNYWVVVNGREYPFKHLTRIAYQLAIGKEEWLDFQSTEGYRKYIADLGFEFKYYKEGYNFFTADEIDLYHSVAGTAYSSSDDEHKRIGEHLKIFARKINLWAELSCVDDYEFKLDRRWQLSGNFNKDQWTVIRAYGSKPQISFFIGITGAGDLFVNLDYQRVDLTGVKKVTEEKQILIDAYKRDAGYQRFEIKRALIPTYTWDKLVAQTQEHLIQHTSLYWELQALLDGTVAPKPSGTDATKGAEDEVGLEPDDVPTKTKSYADRNRTFKGTEVNWERKAAASNKLGYEGEQLVIRYEQKKLRDLELGELADKVAKQGDGAGYDILSYDKNGDEMHIEVKTTTGGRDEPFYMSIHEKAYLEQHPENYFLYRVYNFSHVTKRGRFYKMNSEEVQKITFIPIGFEVSI